MINETIVSSSSSFLSIWNLFIYFGRLDRGLNFCSFGCNNRNWDRCPGSGESEEKWGSLAPRFDSIKVQLNWPLSFVTQANWIAFSFLISSPLLPLLLLFLLFLLFLFLLQIKILLHSIDRCIGSNLLSASYANERVTYLHFIATFVFVVVVVTVVAAVVVGVVLEERASLSAPNQPLSLVAPTLIVNYLFARDQYRFLISSYWNEVSNFSLFG